MPNTFGTTTKRVRLVDPRAARQNRQRFRRDMLPQLEMANSLYVPINEPARGWILLTRSDYDLVRGYGTNLQLEIDSFDSKTSALTFSGLSIVQAQSVTTGVAGDTSALYLVELTDARGILKNQWFQWPTNSYYNVLSPAYPGNYYENSKLAGSAYSWTQFVGDLWTQMGTFLGPYPGLPDALTGVPVNWNLPGVSAYQALCDGLTHLGLGISCNLTQAVPYGICSLGDSDTVFDAMVTSYAGRLEDDLEYIDLGAGRVPGQMVVYFRRVNEYYGTEETIRRDSNQWATNATYSITVSAPAAFLGAVGIGYLRDDFPIRYDINGVPLAVDIVTANKIAVERVGQYFDVIYSRTSGYMNRTYAGCLPFYAGSKVDGVCWKQNLRERRAGWTTQIVRGDLWKNVY